MDEDELEELAEEWGVDPDTAEAMWSTLDEEAQAIWSGPHEALTGAELESYLDDLAEILDIDIHDLYEMWHGYEP